MLSVVYAECCKWALYAACRYAECRYAECRGSLDIDKELVDPWPHNQHVITNNSNVYFCCDFSSVEQKWLFIVIWHQKTPIIQTQMYKRLSLAAALGMTKAGKTYWIGKLSTLDLLVLTSLDQILFKLKTKFNFLHVMRRSTVVSLPPQLVFPGQSHNNYCYEPSHTLLSSLSQTYIFNNLAFENSLLNKAWAWLHLWVWPVHSNRCYELSHTLLCSLSQTYRLDNLAPWGQIIRQKL